MTRKTFVKNIRAEYLSLAIGLLVVGLMTSTPLNLDFTKSFDDFEKMGIKVIYLLIGGFAIAYFTAKTISKISHIAARLISSAGVLMMFYPFLSLISAIEEPSGWMVVGTLMSIAIFSYVIADVICAKHSSYYKEMTEE
jgi:hypothetical protein